MSKQKKKVKFCLPPVEDLSKYTRKFIENNRTATPQEVHAWVIDQWAKFHQEETKGPFAEEFEKYVKERRKYWRELEFLRRHKKKTDPEYDLQKMKLKRKLRRCSKHFGEKVLDKYISHHDAFDRDSYNIMDENRAVD